LEKCKVCGGDIPFRYRSFCSEYCRNKFYQKKYKDKNKAIHLAKVDELASVKSPNKIQCQICGRWYIQLCTHVYLRHGLLARDYKKMFGLDVSRGKLPAWYRELKGRTTLENGTFSNLKAGKNFWFVKGDKKAGRYVRSAETMARIKKLKQ
jgi:predicted nucleic acid-binding Zn ribbon protein